MSNLIAFQYKPSHTGFLPSLTSPDSKEIIASNTGGGSAGAPGSVLNGEAFLTGTGTVYFNPVVTPPLGALKLFTQTTGTTTLTPATGTAFIQGTVTVNTIVIPAASKAVLQFVGLSGTTEVYRLVSYTSLVTLT